MYFAGNFSCLLYIECFVDLRETTFSEKTEELVLFDWWPVCHAGLWVYFAVAREFLLEEEFVLFYVEGFLLLESF